ncbi:MAG: SRPBCC family protein [Hyphomonadaceae bacterium]
MTARPAAIAVQTFKVPPQRVYDAILDPEMVARFMFGPLLREETILHISNDPRVGGAFSFKVRRGENEIDHVGKYLELTPPKRVAFTWAIVGQGDDDPSTVTIDITPTAEGCSVRLMHEMAPEWADFIDRARLSWEKMLGVLATLL